jgi:serine/threonine protein kinase
MGRVYRARDTKLGRDIAIKVIKVAPTDDPHTLARFNREARAAAALNHPHIVTIFSIEETDGLRFITMELIEGQTLNHHIPAAGMPLPAFLEIAIPLAEALQAAHQKSITHRDLKPRNVMVTEDGRVKVLDFGLAINTSVVPTDSGKPGEVEQFRTEAGLILGTAPYMSPEQVETRPFDHRTDIFSLGVLMYEMIGGTRPFRGNTWAGIIASILKDEPTPLETIRADVPLELPALIMRCLLKDAAARPEAVSVVVKELREMRRALETKAGSAPGETAAPAAPQETSTRPDHDSARPVATPPSTAEPLPTRILIVDDDVSLSAMLTEYLGSLGYDVESVANGLVGLERALSGDFAAVILDVRLPGLNGIEVLRRLRESSKVRVILWSAMGDEPDRVAGLEIGADDYLPKSSSPRELLARLRSVLRR